MTPPPRPPLAVVMPVYNEQDVIVKVLEKWIAEFERANVSYELHVYNDGSHDGTINRLHLFASTHPHVRGHDKINEGHGPTILRGYCENADAEWIFQVDSDDEIDPAGFLELWQRREAHDFLIGRRQNRQSGWPRQALSSLSRRAVHLLYGHGVWDVNSPCRLMRSAAFREWFQRIPPRTFAPNVILSGLASLRHLRICEVPVGHRRRTTGQVSLAGLKLIPMALRSFFEILRFRLTISKRTAVETSQVSVSSDFPSPTKRSKSEGSWTKP